MAVLCLVMTSCSKEDSPETEELDYTIDLSLVNETDWEMANEILSLVNDHRVSIGLNSIQADDSYASAYAVEHTKYMISVEQINHDNFPYRTEALKHHGAENVGENVAYGYETAEAAVSAWLLSPGHKSVIEGNYTHSGFGIVQSSEGRNYFTQLFYRK